MNHLRWAGNLCWWVGGLPCCNVNIQLVQFIRRHLSLLPSTTTFFPNPFCRTKSPFQKIWRAFRPGTCLQVVLLPPWLVLLVLQELLPCHINNLNHFDLLFLCISSIGRQFKMNSDMDATGELKSHWTLKYFSLQSHQGIASGTGASSPFRVLPCIYEPSINYTRALSDYISLIPSLPAWGIFLYLQWNLYRI